MDVKQLKVLVTSAVAQATGAEISELDTKELVDVGKDVLDSGSVDAFVKALINQVGKIVVMSEKYKADLPDLFIEDWEWGAYLERVYPDLASYDINNTYNLVDGQEYPAHIFYKPHVSAKAFTELKTIETRISIASDETIKLAFSSWGEMNTFVGGIEQSIENTLEVALEEMAQMLISSAIAISDKATGSAVHLLTDYNAEFSTNLSTDEAMSNVGFLRYATMRINQYKSYIRRMTKGLFNNGNMNTWTRGENSKMVLLTDFKSRLNTFLLGSSDTFNPSVYSIGEYHEMPWFQSPTGESSSLTFEDNSHIIIKADATNKLGIGTAKYDESNCIGLLYDRRAIGTSFNGRKTTSEYTASADFWTYFHKLKGNYIIDSNFPMIAFFVD